MRVEFVRGLLTVALRRTPPHHDIVPEVSTFHVTVQSKRINFNVTVSQTL